MLGDRTPPVPVQKNQVLPARSAESSKQEEEGERSKEETNSMASSKGSSLNNKLAGSTKKISLTNKKLKKQASSITSQSSAGSSDLAVKTQKSFKVELKTTAVKKKGVEEHRKSFHSRMNRFNLVSSFLGLMGLVLQMIEVWRQVT